MKERVSPRDVTSTMLDQDSVPGKSRSKGLFASASVQKGHGDSLLAAKLLDEPKGKFSAQANFRSSCTLATSYVRGSIKRDKEQFCMGICTVALVVSFAALLIGAVGLRCVILCDVGVSLQLSRIPCVQSNNFLSFG